MYTHTNVYFCEQRCLRMCTHHHTSSHVCTCWEKPPPSILQRGKLRHGVLGPVSSQGMQLPVPPIPWPWQGGQHSPHTEGGAACGWQWLGGLEPPAPQGGGRGDSSAWFPPLSAHRGALSRRHRGRKAGRGGRGQRGVMEGLGGLWGGDRVGGGGWRFSGGGGGLLPPLG